mmetsp:Transcript_32434/g.78767  ORF Transcript_32434/g.78767 Transcript_32434/m.78767 type:complete len:576 (-) Transcript_32434:86-1813(-)
MTIKRQADVAPRASKRLKIKARLEEAVTISSTLFGCTDIVSELFSFLDAKSLLKFSCVKDFSSLLTYQHVVRAAMMSGGYGATSLERMIAPIQNQMVWIPSPQRLLRVVSGKRCEKCCHTTRYVSPYIGLFLCNKCMVTYTEKVYRKNPMKQFLDAKRVQRVPRKGPRSPHRFLIKAQMQDSTGANIGPIVTLQDIRQVQKLENMSPSDKVKVHVAECDARQPNAESAANAILSAVSKNRGDATARKDAKLKAKLEGQQRFEQARKKRVDQLLVDLKALVGDQVAWKSNLDNRFWRSYGNQYFFSDPILQGILQPMFKAPSKINKAILCEIPTRIQTVVGKRALMDQYIQRIVDFVNDEDDGERALRHGWNTHGFHYDFYNGPIGKILAEPLKNPHALKEEDLSKLCQQVKAIINRKHTGRVVLQKLSAKLEGIPFKEDVEQHYWSPYQWSFGFRRQHIHRVLKEPLLTPEEITEEKLDALVEQLRVALEKKQKVHRQVELLLGPTRKYTVWFRMLNSWWWDSKNNRVRFHNNIARRLLDAKFSDMDNLTDETILGLSKDIIQAFEKKYGTNTQS